MARVRRGVIDLITSYDELYIDGEIPPAEEDYYEIFAPINSALLPYTTITVWGRGLVSFGPPTEGQFEFMANLANSTDLSQFPGDWVSFGFSADAIELIPILYYDWWAGGASIGASPSGIFITPDGINLPGAWSIGGQSGSGGTFLYWSDLVVQEGTNASETLVVSSLPETLLGLDGDDTLMGAGGSDALFGGAGNDHLIGGGGNDRLFGGEGDDLLDPGVEYVDRTQFGGFAEATEIREALIVDGGAGFDTLRVDYSASPVSIGLRADDLLSKPTILNMEAIEVVGSQFADVIIGTSAGDRLFGGGGFDVLEGNAGNDWLDAGPAGPAAIGFAPDSGQSNIDAISLNSYFVATSGSPTASFALTAAAIFYDMQGFYPTYGGPETFSFTAEAGATLEVRLAVAGDTFMTFADYSLTSSTGVEIERQFHEDPDPEQSYGYFVLAEAGTYYLTAAVYPGVWQGGVAEFHLSLTSAQVMTGNRLIGGEGDDTYVVHSGSDEVVERAGQGTDHVRSSVSFDLAANVENLTLTGSAAINGTGNGLANAISGNGSANRIIGGAGADTLTGGGGPDRFVFTSLSDSAPGAADRILDFSGKTKRGNGDKIDLSAIDANSNTAAHDSFHFVNKFSGKAGQVFSSYDEQSGLTSIYLDVDGDRSADMVIELLGNVKLTATDFIL